MTPKDKHTEVAWQAKQREVKTGSVEKTVHSATSAIYTASEIRSVMSHSETQEITGNHITREQQLQNMRLATQKYLQPENQVNTQSILPENTGHTEQAAVQPEILWYKNESNYVPEQPVYNGSSEKYEAKAAQFHAPVSETYKIPEKPDRQVAREQQLKSIRLATQKYVQTEAGRSHAEEKQQTTHFILKSTGSEREDNIEAASENRIQENHGKKYAAAKMRASIPNTEQLEMSENNDIKEEKRQSMRLAMWKYLRRQDTENTQGIGIEEKRNGNPLSGKPTLFQQEEEESNTDEREKKKDFSRKYTIDRIQSSTVQDSKGEELSSNQSKTFRQHHQILNTASMLHGMTAANVEKEVEDDEPDSQNDLKKSKSLIYLAKLKKNRKKEKITSKNTSEDSEISEESSTEEEKETLGEDEEKTSNQKKEIKNKEHTEKTSEKNPAEDKDRQEIKPSQAAEEWNKEMDHAEEEDSEDDSGSKKRKAKKKNRKESDTEKSGKNEKDSNDRKRKKDEKSSRKEGKIRASLKWFRRTKNFHTTVQSLRLSGNEEEIKKRADYQQRMLLRHGVINTAKISASIIKIIASNVLLLLPIISLFLLLSLLFLGVKAERQSASSAYDGACYLAAKYESGGNPDQVGGDGGNACGEFQFDNRYELGPFVRWCYEKDPTTYGPFEPYLGMTTELKNNAGFYGAWHSICIEHKIAFEAVQCEYVYTQTLQPLLTSLTEYYGFDFTNASDALKGCVLSFGNRDGKYVVSLKRYFDGTTSASTDREIIERAYDAMIARRPNVSRWSYEKADCLAQLDGTLDIYAPSENGAGGIDWSWKKSIGAGESGNAAVQAALNAVGSGYSQSRRDDPGWYDCSSLVYRSYAAAGITYLNGMDAASEAECLVNKGMTVSYGELQPGDLIFYSYSANGKYRNISHVAIYLGNGEMVHAADESRGVCKQAMSQSNLSPQLYCRPQ